MKVVELKGKYSIEIHANKKNIITKFVVTGVGKELVKAVKVMNDGGVVEMIGDKLVDFYPDIQFIMPEVRKILVQAYGRPRGES